MADLPKEPVTRQEMYLSRLAGENTTLPIEPVTREEMYLEGAIDRVEAVEQEVEEMKDNPDVADIVATYADLQAYDTSKLTDKDVIRVLADETHDGNSTYYRYSKSSGTFTYIGSSKQYSNFVGTDGTAAGEAGLVPAPATTDVGKYLKADGSWATVQAGPTVVQTIGASTTDVMSQDATTKLVYPQGSVYTDRIGIGLYARPNSMQAVAIGSSSYVGESNGVALGASAHVNNKYSVALGDDSETTRQGEVYIGCANNDHGYNNTRLRVIGGVHSPVNSDDAATKGYVDGLVGNVAAALNAINNGTGA